MYVSICCQYPLSSRIFLQDAQIGMNPRRTLTSLRACSRSLFFCANSRSWAFRASISRFKVRADVTRATSSSRSEEHTSELQSRLHLVCRLLLEKKKIDLRLSLTSLQSPGFQRLSRRMMSLHTTRRMTNFLLFKPNMLCLGARCMSDSVSTK